VADRRPERETTESGTCCARNVLSLLRQAALPLVVTRDLPEPPPLGGSALDHRPMTGTGVDESVVVPSPDWAHE
jgi:hypothetical protein